MKDKDREMISHLMDGEWGDLDLSRCLADVCKSEEQKRVWGRYHLARDGMRSESVDETFSIASRVSAAIAAEPGYSNVTAIVSSEASPAQHQTGEHDDSRDPIRKGTMRSHSGVNGTAASGQQGQSVRSAGSRWGLGAAGFGIAASAALATVVGLDYWDNRGLNIGSSELAAVAVQNPSVPTTTGTAVPAVAQSPLLQNVANRNSGAAPGIYWSTGQGGQRAATVENRLNQLLGDHIEHSPAGNWNGVLPYSWLVGYDSTVVNGE